VIREVIPRAHHTRSPQTTQRAAANLGIVQALAMRHFMNKALALASKRSQLSAANPKLLAITARSCDSACTVSKMHHRAIAKTNSMMLERHPAERSPNKHVAWGATFGHLRFLVNF